MPKPTILIALDSHSAAFCNAIKTQLQELNTVQSRLIQIYTLVGENQAFSFNSELDKFADWSFELESDGKQKFVSQINAQFNQTINTLQTELIDLIKTATQSESAIALKRQGVEISSTHRIYLMLSIGNPEVRGIVFELVRLIRWLFNKYFTDVPYSLEGLLLLPGLFSQVTTADYSEAYTLLRELDYKMSSGVAKTVTPNLPPFHNCWLCDERIGGLKDNLTSYADAFAGFLTLEAETNGLLIGTQKVRGKLPAYSAFGYGELFFPSEIIINRLSASLAADILDRQFLPQAKSTLEVNRKWLLDTKEFILNEDFSNAFLELERDNGKPVWQDFNPRINLQAGMAREYGMELQRAYKQFEKKELLSYKRTLENSCQQVQLALNTYLDRRINYYADATPTGLHEAVTLLNLLTYLYIELQAESINEQPQNLITELHAAEAFIDSQLEIKINRETTQKLLNQVYYLRLQRQQIQDNLAQGESEELRQEIKTIQEQLKTVIDEYHQALNSEIEQTRQIRFVAITQAREEAQKAIDANIKHLNSAENHLETATDKRNEIIEEENLFRKQYLIIFPGIVAVGIISILIVIGIFNQSILWLLLRNFWSNLAPYLLGTAVNVLIYLGIVLLKYNSKIRHRLIKVQKQIKQLESSLKANAVELRRSYNEQLKLEYDLYVQKLRVEALNHLIKTVKQKAVNLRQSLAEISGIYHKLVQEREQSTTKFSENRLAVLTDTDVDIYYQNFLAKFPTDKFTTLIVSRSKSWKISAEEFQNKLIPFARQQFEQLSNLSVAQVLKQTDLIAENTANIRLNQLYDSSNLLLRIQDIDANLNPTSQKETTLWVCAEDKEEMFETYSRFSRSLTPVVAEDKDRLCILTRSLGFPAYFLGQIEFYRDCYERTQNEPDEIPDLIPDEIGSNKQLKLAYQNLFLAIALGLVSQNTQEDYQFNGGLIGKDREEISQALVNEFSLEEIYEEIRQSIETFEHDLIYQKLQKLGTDIKDLTSYERKLLDNLLSDYNPLN
ncbi:hypothetical protein [Rivularia sp. UHCC 0363]|uniref:hypothetical protein n=1 Tax=Rivularia sp. UHCC 0363 TaxID=3110244 RepID=UPI002B217F5D|nr:hypothetical protein [Rivularia sp. UHCC 0363]MEA5596470.1 hypothetical protein [Rivularia sp. UHCC 0363]